MRERGGEKKSFLVALFFLRQYLTRITAKLLILGGSNTLKFDFSDKMTIGDHSKRFKSQEDCSEKRERKQDRELAGCFVFHALVSDRNDCKSLIFLCQNALKIDFSDKMSIGNHSKRFKGEED